MTLKGVTVKTLESLDISVVVGVLNMISRYLYVVVYKKNRPVNQGIQEAENPSSLP